MKKKFLLFSVSLLLVACGNQVDTTSEDNSTSSQEEITISLKEKYEYSQKEHHNIAEKIAEKIKLSWRCLARINPSDFHILHLQYNYGKDENSFIY